MFQIRLVFQSVSAAILILLTCGITFAADGSPSYYGRRLYSSALPDWYRPPSIYSRQYQPSYQPSYRVDSLYNHGQRIYGADLPNYARIPSPGTSPFAYRYAFGYGYYSYGWNSPYSIPGSLYNLYRPWYGVSPGYWFYRPWYLYPQSYWLYRPWYLYPQSYWLYRPWYLYPQSYWLYYDADNDVDPVSMHHVPYYFDNGGHQQSRASTHLR